MAFFDDLSENVANVAREVGTKAAELSRIAKIQANIKAEEIKIHDLYYKLGKKYYEMYAATADAGVEDIVKKINDANDKINEYKQDLNEGNMDSDFEDESCVKRTTAMNTITDTTTDTATDTATDMASDMNDFIED